MFASAFLCIQNVSQRVQREEMCAFSFNVWEFSYHHFIRLTMISCNHVYSTYFKIQNEQCTVRNFFPYFPPKYVLYCGTMGDVGFLKSDSSVEN